MDLSRRQGAPAFIKLAPSRSLPCLMACSRDDQIANFDLVRLPDGMTWGDMFAAAAYRADDSNYRTAKNLQHSFRSSKGALRQSTIT